MNGEPNFSLSVEHTAQITPSNGEVRSSFDCFQITGLEKGRGGKGEGRGKIQKDPLERDKHSQKARSINFSKTLRKPQIRARFHSASSAINLLNFFTFNDPPGRRVLHFIFSQFYFLVQQQFTCWSSAMMLDTKKEKCSLQKKEGINDSLKNRDNLLLWA